MGDGLATINTANLTAAVKHVFQSPLNDGISSTVAAATSVDLKANKTANKKKPRKKKPCKSAVVSENKEVVDAVISMPDPGILSANEKPGIPICNQHMSLNHPDPVSIQPTYEQSTQDTTDRPLASGEITTSKQDGNGGPVLPDPLSQIPPFMVKQILSCISPLTIPDGQNGLDGQSNNLKFSIENLPVPQEEGGLQNSSLSNNNELVQSAFQGVQGHIEETGTPGQVQISASLLQNLLQGISHPLGNVKNQNSQTGSLPSIQQFASQPLQVLMQSLFPQESVTAATPVSSHLHINSSPDSSIVTSSSPSETTPVFSVNHASAYRPTTSVHSSEQPHTSPILQQLSALRPSTAPVPEQANLQLIPGVQHMSKPQLFDHIINIHSNQEVSTPESHTVFQNSIAKSGETIGSTGTGSAAVAAKDSGVQVRGLPLLVQQTGLPGEPLQLIPLDRTVNIQLLREILQRVSEQQAPPPSYPNPSVSTTQQIPVSIFPKYSSQNQIRPDLASQHSDSAQHSPLSIVSTGMELSSAALSSHSPQKRPLQQTSAVAQNQPIDNGIQNALAPLPQAAENLQQLSDISQVNGLGFELSSSETYITEHQNQQNVLQSQSEHHPNPTQIQSGFHQADFPISPNAQARAEIHNVCSQIVVSGAVTSTNLQCSQKMDADTSFMGKGHAQQRLEEDMVRSPSYVAEPVITSNLGLHMSQTSYDLTGQQSTIEQCNTRGITCPAGTDCRRHKFCFLYFTTFGSSVDIAVPLLSASSENDSNQENNAPVGSGRTFCVDCNKLLASGCNVHNTEYEYISDSPFLSRARMTLPKCFTLQQTGTSDFENLMGVWCKGCLSERTRFGPMIGLTRDIANLDFSEQVHGFQPFVISKTEETTEILMMSDENQCNWMMFIRFAPTLLEQNCTVYCDSGKFYIVTKTEIKEEELLMWFSAEMCLHLGISQNPGNHQFQQCSECGLYFLIKRLLNAHIKAKHPEKYKYTISCYICPKKFKTKAKLNAHLATHMYGKHHNCPYCKKSFSDSSNLKMHLLIHTGEKNFMCNTCGKKFRQKSHLEIHQVVHSGEKKFECPYCDKSFGRRSDLKTHTYSHTKEVIHRCEVCGKEFCKTQNLKKHMKVHTGERNYMCNKCFKGFQTKYHRDRHLKICKEKNGKEYMSLEEVAKSDTFDVAPLPKVNEEYVEMQ